MKRIHLSPVTPVVVALTLVLGILVSDLTGLRVLPTANAQTATDAVSVSTGQLAGGLIEARGVVINGVATDGVFGSAVSIGDSLVESGCGVNFLGVTTGGDTVYALGVFVGGNVAPTDEVATDGVFVGGNVAPSDEVATDGVFVGDALQVSGGTLSGSDIQVSDGVISGRDLRVSGARVTGMCAQ